MAIDKAQDVARIVELVRLLALVGAYSERAGEFAFQNKTGGFAHGGEGFAIHAHLWRIR